MVAKIKIEGCSYTVTEDLGYQAGYHSKAVETEEGERIAVKRGGKWEWWGLHDRLRDPE